MTVAGFIAGQRTEHHVPHTVACRALGVSESWFYKWRSRPEQPTNCEVRRAALTERITHFFNASGRKSLTRQGKRKVARDLVRRRFDAIAPDVLWWGDMTEIETGEGKLYLASVHDAFSRRVLGYAMGERHDAALVSASLKMAAATRGGTVDGVIFHSDSEYVKYRMSRAS